MKFKSTTNTEPIEISLSELKKLIKQGKVLPTALIQSKILTNDEWWTIDNLRIFHKNSSTKHPFGKHLVARLEDEKQKENQKKLIADRIEAYNRGTLIEDRYRLTPLAGIIDQLDILGATRLLVLASFQPEKIFTFVFTASLVHIEATEGATAVWDSMSMRPETFRVPFDPDRVQRAKATLNLKRAPRPFCTWDELVSDAKAALDYSSPRLILDGIAYRHKVRDKEIAIDVTWENPNNEENTPQIALIKAYRDCLEIAGLAQFPVL